MNTTTTNVETANKSNPARPNVYAYLNYRDFLKDSYAHRKEVNPRFSENAFALAAGFGKNSRGYLGLVVKGKRNLTAKSIVGFARALALGPKEALFFENMVHFCQAEDEKERIYYFERLKVASQGESSAPVAFLDSHLRFLNEWHLVVLREIINLADFNEDPAWIYKRLGGKISISKIEEGLRDLLVLDLIGRDGSGKLVQQNPLMQFKDAKSNFRNTSNLHKDFAIRASESIINDPYEKRAAQLITLSIPKDSLEEIRLEMQKIAEEMLKKYGNASIGSQNQVVQMGIQLLQITN